MNDKRDICAIVDAQLARKWYLENGIFAICDVDWTVDWRGNLNCRIAGVDDMDRIVQAVTSKLRKLK